MQDEGASERDYHFIRRLVHSARARGNQMLESNDFHKKI